MNEQTNNPVLVVKNLTKKFVTKRFFRTKETFVAVNDISFELNKGEVLGVLGPNGAGKTTTINMLLGLLTPTSGSISYFGKDFACYRSEIMTKVSFASTYLKLPGSLTVGENLDIYGRLYGLPTALRKANIEKNMQFFGIAELRDRLTRNLSAGQLTRLMLAKAFLPNPSIVLLDEPTASLDPDIAIQIRKFILEEKNSSGTSILFTSHNMFEVEEVCDRVVVIKSGKIIASDSPANLAGKIKTCNIQFLIPKNIEILINYAKDKKVSHKVEDAYVTIEIDEQKIADLLSDISRLDVKYTEISIKKPTLEDYFLQTLKA